MKKPGVPRLRLVFVAFVAALLAIVLAAFAPRLYRMVRASTSVRRVERSALEVLKQEHLAFLVTDRITSQILVESTESNLILGQKEGYLIAKARLYYGIDVSKLSADDLVRTNGTLVVNLPPPEELDFAVDLESMRFISKRSGLQVIADWVTNADQEQELRDQFKEAALQYMRDEKLIPSKEAILQRLSSFSDMFSEYIGVQVVFR
jgi:hypothetical protein